MRHFFNSRIRTILIVAVLLALILTVISSLTGFSLPDMMVKGVLTPIRAGVSKLTDRAEQFYSYMFRYESVAAENERLKEELAQIEDRARQADSVARENERLRNLLELPLMQEGYDVVDSYIISHSSTDWSSTFTINRGTNVGISEGLCVITANGELVGLVEEVGPNYSVVKSVLDSSLEISASIASSGYNGMVKGGYSTGLEGLLRMSYLPSDATIRNNDQIVTTGSTVYPRDLVLGYVVDAGFDDTGVSKFALLEPAADVGALEQVFIITNYNVG